MNFAPGSCPSNSSGASILSGCTCDTGVSVSIVAAINFMAVRFSLRTTLQI